MHWVRNGWEYLEGKWSSADPGEAALASNPEVGSSMNTIEGFATSSTAMVNLFRCSVERPLTPGNPTSACLSGESSTSSITSSMNNCYYQ
ncbi:hypothetical protein F8388_027096 [Cannabis sativa]|uniref:Uncharacterized protein n=1 Tax=Cannabis sativa TaxID=3483 RepID=A0A7J6FNX4_CANSA|nr:hypothetical protein F8388_027096 [Cannabis sativa]KAF4387818.1 hypothetical protein G4B88_004145 [Cannabis sativa]